MELRLLGPVELWTEGRPVDAGPPRQRTVLAALGVDAGQPVMVETIVDRVWGEAPPERVRHALYVYIARLRELLRQASAADPVPARLVRRSGGYLLEIEPDDVDVHRFRALIERSRDPGSPDTERVVLLRQALDLWLGTPLAGLSGEWPAMVRENWRKQYLEAVLGWAHAQLRVGGPGVVIARLAGLVDEYPLMEPLNAAYMRALVAGGRPAEALDWYGRTRQRLVDQLGTEPGGELQHLHRAILRGEVGEPTPTPVPAAEAAAAAPVPAARAAAARSVPAQLPLDVPGFAGRQAALAELDATLAAAAERGAPVVISALSGTAGVGKTALAVHWARRVADRFPDGQLYVNLRGFDPGGSPTSPSEVLRGFLDALGVPPHRVPASLDAQTGRYRSLLSGRRMLIVLDNAGSAEQVRPLLPGSSGCLVLITSRNRLSGLIATDGAHPLVLDLLSVGEARELLAGRLGARRVAAEPAAVDEIIGWCARLPLALATVAAYAVTQPALSMATLAGELRGARGRLDPFSAEDPATDVRAVFSWSYRTLGEPAARLFRLLGLHPGPDIAGYPAADLAGIPVAAVRPLLTELAQANLLTERAPGRYACHDLLRAYAIELTGAIDSDCERRAALHRVLDHYLHTAHTAALLVEPQREPISLLARRRDVQPEPLAAEPAAMAWFAAEHRVLLRMIDKAVAEGFDGHAWQLAWTLVTFLNRAGHWDDWAATLQTAVAATERLGDRAGQARTHRALALASARLGRFDEGYRHFAAALAAYGEVGDEVGRAHTHFNLAWLAGRQSRYDDALRHGQQALDRYRATGHLAGQANALNTVGWCRGHLGDHQQALTCCEQSIALHQRLGDRYGQSAAWDSLGYTNSRLGHYAQATACYLRALELRRELRDRYYEARTLTHLGDTQHAAGNLDASREAWREAVAILDELQDPAADEVREKLLGPGRGRPVSPVG